MTSATMRREECSGTADLPELMVRYQRGEVEAVEELVRRLSPMLLRFFLASGVPPGDAEDEVQNCWLRIHRARHTYRASEPVLPWIFAIARHTQVDGYRRRRRRFAREVSTAEPPEGVAVQTSAPRVDDTLQLLESLPEKQREVVLMLKVSGMSLEDVARATSSTVGAVKQKAHRAYSKLRKLLEKGS